jgi:hypothetical protein
VEVSHATGRVRFFINRGGGFVFLCVVEVKVNKHTKIQYYCVSRLVIWYACYKLRGGMDHIFAEGPHRFIIRYI